MKFTIDHHSPIPFHAQVEELLRELQKEKEYRDGKLLPNEVELAKQLGISRNTIRQATNKLVIEGLLIRKKGVGTKFSDTSIDTRINNWSSFSQEMNSKGMVVKNYEIKTSWVKASETVKQFLKIDATEVLQLERLRGTPELPFVMFYSWFHPRVGLTGKEDFSKPLYEILENDYSTIAILSQEEISACAADKLLAKKLDLEEGDPVLKRIRMVYDPGRRPIEYNIGYYRGDSFTYKIESER